MNRATLLKLSKQPNISPLRYPGGKRKLATLVSDIISLSEEPVELLVEPFAGGAAVSIALLESGFCQEIGLADKDGLVASFWKTVFSTEAANLAELVASATVTVEEWQRQKTADPNDSLGKAYKCLFLNRTSFSGILNERSGPIGGYSQKRKYKIDCRFNRATISERIQKLSQLRDRVRFVRCQSYRQTICQVSRTRQARENPESIFWYFDPPFFRKAPRLYRYAFDSVAHIAFKRVLLGDVVGHWVLSYDDVPEARYLYEDHPGFALVPFVYNARIETAQRFVSTEIIVSDVIAAIRHCPIQSKKFANSLSDLAGDLSRILIRPTESSIDPN